ncbi:MAG: hypothetical protein HY882_06385 [Deltaproteobacteria bacterium]|nr:hypothetical protein [Deltaproteobacteria bacterium]
MNPIRPRYTGMAAANLPEVVKPATGREEMSGSTCRAVRGDWGGRAPKDQAGTLGGPAPCVPPRRKGTTSVGNP